MCCPVRVIQDAYVYADAFWFLFSSDRLWERVPRYVELIKNYRFLTSPGEPPPALATFNSKARIGAVTRADCEILNVRVCKSLDEAYDIKGARSNARCAAARHEDVDRINAADFSRNRAQGHAHVRVWAQHSDIKIDKCSVDARDHDALHFARKKLMTHMPMTGPKKARRPDLSKQYLNKIDLVINGRYRLLDANVYRSVGLYNGATGTLRGLRFVRPPSSLVPDIEEAVNRPMSHSMVLLLEMDEYSGPPLSEKYELQGLDEATNLTKIIAVPMSTCAAIQQPRQTPCVYEFNQVLSARARDKRIRNLSGRRTIKQSDRTFLPRNCSIAFNINLQLRRARCRRKNRIKIDLTSRGKVSGMRIQFAIAPACATTIHVNQGITAFNGFIMMPAKYMAGLFEFSLNYVGTSRPRDLEHLFLLDKLTPDMFNSFLSQRLLVRQEYEYLRNKPGQPQDGLALPALSPADVDPTLRAVVT